MKIKFQFPMATIFLFGLLHSACNSGNNKNSSETSWKDTVITRIDTERIQMPDGTWKDTVIVQIDSMKIENGK